MEIIEKKKESKIDTIEAHVFDAYANDIRVAVDVTVYNGPIGKQRRNSSVIFLNKEMTMQLIEQLTACLPRLPELPAKKPRLVE